MVWITNRVGLIVMVFAFLLVAAESEGGLNDGTTIGLLWLHEFECCS